MRGADSPHFNQFRDRIARETTHTLRYEGQPAEKAEDLAKRWDSAGQDRFYVGAFHDGVLVGYLFCYKPQPDHPWMNHVAAFAMMIVQDFWGVGLGPLMLRELDELAVRHGISKMEATVRANNERAFQLYKKMGYEIEGLRRRAARIDGHYLDEYFIAKFY